MGLDAIIAVRADGITDQDITDARRYFADRNVSRALPERHIDDWVQIYADTRYYGPWYERGDWPRIYALILMMNTVFDRPVHYTDDTQYLPDTGPVTESQLARIWTHYLDPHHHTTKENDR